VTSGLPYLASATFASLVGAAGFVLAVQAWLKFHGSPFGRLLSILPVFMAVLALYHPVLVVAPAYTELALLTETGGFALLVVFAAYAIVLHRRMAAGVRN